MKPLRLGQNRAILDDIFICRKKNLELIHPDVTLESTTLIGVALVCNHLHAGCPLSKFARPVGHGRQRDNDKVGSPQTFCLDEEGDQRDGLDSFAETLADKVNLN